MIGTFIGATPEDIVARVEAAVSGAAGVAVVVRVGAEVHSYRNVGVDLPRARRSTEEARALRRRVSEAAEAAGVALAENALAPKVGGDLRGSVQVREVRRSGGDASHLMRGPQRRP
jgi:hypothetical protein